MTSATQPPLDIKHPWLLRGIVLLATTLVFIPSLNGDFLNWDDDRFVVDNPHVDGLTIRNITHAFSGLRFESYQPLHLISYMIDGSLWPKHPLGYRLHNLFLYLIGVLLLYEWLLKQNFPLVPATFGTLFFAIAPYRVESVVWIACRKDVLMLVFVLGAWHLHFMAGGSRHKTWIRIAAAIAFICALLSKSSALVFPILVFIVDITLRGKSRSVALKGILPYLPPALILGAALPVIWSDAALIRASSETTFPGRIELVGWTLYHYGTTILFPFDLSPLYAAPSESAMRRGLMIAGIVLTVAVAALISSLKKGAPLYRTVGTCLLILVPLIPFLNLIPLYYLVADRYLLLPSIGIAVGVATIIEQKSQKRGRAVTLFIASLLVVVMGITAAIEAAYWTDREALWGHAVSREPDSYYARLKYGETLRAAGKPVQSVRQYREAQRIRPLSPLALGGIFWGELLVDIETQGDAKDLPAPDKMVASFLAIANDGPKLDRFATALEQRGFERAAAVVRERIAPSAR